MGLGRGRASVLAVCRAMSPGGLELLACPRRTGLLRDGGPLDPGEEAFIAWKSLAGSSCLFQTLRFVGSRHHAQERWDLPK